MKSLIRLIYRQTNRGFMLLKHVDGSSMSMLETTVSKIIVLHGLMSVSNISI